MVELAPIDCPRPERMKGKMLVEFAPGMFPPGFCREAIALERYRSSEHEPPGPGKTKKVSERYRSSDTYNGRSFRLQVPVWPVGLHARYFAALSTLEP